MLRQCCASGPFWVQCSKSDDTKPKQHVSSRHRGSCHSHSSIRRISDSCTNLTFGQRYLREAQSLWYPGINGDAFLFAIPLISASSTTLLHLSSSKLQCGLYQGTTRCDPTTWRDGIGLIDSAWCENVQWPVLYPGPRKVMHGINTSHIGATGSRRTLTFGGTDKYS